MRVNTTKSAGFGQTEPFLKQVRMFGTVCSGNEGTGAGWEPLTAQKWGTALHGSVWGTFSASHTSNMTTTVSKLKTESSEFL